MRFNNIDVLRGIAAIMVTLFHLTGSTALKNTLGLYGQYGFLGVEIFFIISGFVLPYSMHKSGYKIADFGNFMVSRIIRIYPAYLVSIIIGIVMAIVTKRYNFTPTEIFGHLVFLNNAISPVFWTLAIEFQFYILIGLLPFLFNGKLFTCILLVAISATSIYFTQAGLIFHWLPFFVLGILAFNKQCLNLQRLNYWLLTSAILLVILKAHGPIFCGISVLTLLAVLYLKVNQETWVGKLFIWFGAISYSLYLTHWELGRAAVAVSRRLPVIGNYDLLKLLIGFLFSILTGWLLFRFVEKPALKISKKIKHSRIKPPEASLDTLNN